MGKMVKTASSQVVVTSETPIKISWVVAIPFYQPLTEINGFEESKGHGTGFEE